MLQTHCSIHLHRTRTSQDFCPESINCKLWHGWLLFPITPKLNKIFHIDKSKLPSPIPAPQNIFFILFRSLQALGPGCFLAQARPFQSALSSLDLKVPGPSFLPPFLLISIMCLFVTEYYALNSFYLIPKRLETLTHTGVEDQSSFHGLSVWPLSFFSHQM